MKIKEKIKKETLSLGEESGKILDFLQGENKNTDGRSF